MQQNTLNDLDELALVPAWSHIIARSEQRINWLIERCVRAICSIWCYQFICSVKLDNLNGVHMVRLVRTHFFFAHHTLAPWCLVTFRVIHTFCPGKSIFGGGRHANNAVMKCIPFVKHYPHTVSSEHNSKMTRQIATVRKILEWRFQVPKRDYFTECQHTHSPSATWCLINSLYPLVSWNVYHVHALIAWSYRAIFDVIIQIFS